MSLTAVDEGDYLKVSFQMKNKDYDLIMIKNSAVDPLHKIYSILDTYKDYTNGYTIPLTDLSTIGSDEAVIIQAMNAIYDFSTTATNNDRVHMSGGIEPYYGNNIYLEKNILLIYINNTNDVGDDGNVTPSTILAKVDRRRGANSYGSVGVYYNMTHNLYNYIIDNSGNNQHVSANSNLSLDTGRNNSNVWAFPGFALQTSLFPHRLMFKDGISIGETYYAHNPNLSSTTDPSKNTFRPMIILPKAPDTNSQATSAGTEEAEATSAGIASEKITAIKEATITMSGTKGVPATTATNAIKDSLTGNKAQINRKRRAAIKLLFAGDSIGETKQLVIPRAKLALSNTFVQEKVLLVKAGSDPINVTTDMSGDEGFYSALADGETFSVILASGNKYTFTRGDEGSEERYTVDISGDSWTGISVNKLTGCANFDTSDPSASGSYLVENDVVGIDGRRFFIGSVGDGGNEIFTGGDPYITPMYGNTYKLPVDEKIYRMFDNNKETDRFLINVEMKKPNKEYAEALNQKILAMNPDADPNSVFFSENMSFMTRVFIQCGNQGLIYDLEEWKLIDKTDNCHVVIEDMDVNRPTMEEYQDEKRVTRRMVFKTKTMGDMIVYLEKYENPQIRSGLNVSQNTNTTNFVGALIRQSKPESIQVNSLVSREMLGEDALVECEADTLSIEYFGNVKTGQKGIRVFR